MSVDGIAGGACHIADNDPLLSQHLVHQGGLANVGTSNDRDSQFIGLLLFLGFLGEGPHHGIQQVTDIHGVGGRQSYGVTQAQIVKLVNIHGLLWAVNLVHPQDNGLLGMAQELCHFLIGVGQATASVHQKEYDVGFLHGQLCLLAHGLQDMVALIKLNAPGVNHGELMVQPLGIHIDAVTGDAGHIVHDGDALLANLVEQGGLAYIGAPHYSHYGFHLLLPSFHI